MSRESIVFARCSRTLIVLLSRKNQKNGQHHHHQLCWETFSWHTLPQTQTDSMIQTYSFKFKWWHIVSSWEPRLPPGADWSHSSGTGATDLCRTLVGLWIYVMYTWYYVCIYMIYYIYLHTMIYMVGPGIYINIYNIHNYIYTVIFELIMFWNVFFTEFYYSHLSITNWDDFWELLLNWVVSLGCGKYIARGILWPVNQLLCHVPFRSNGWIMRPTMIDNGLRSA